MSTHDTLGTQVSGMTMLHVHPDALITLCGPAGSGKSYFARRCFRPHQIVSSDRCREMICDDPTDQAVSADAFDLFYRIIGYRLKHGHLTVADATNLGHEYRTHLLKLARTHARPIYLVVLDTPLEQCLRHNAMRKRQIEPHVIRTHVEAFEKLKSRLECEKQHYMHVCILQPHEVDTVEVILDRKKRERPEPTRAPDRYIRKKPDNPTQVP